MNNSDLQPNDFRQPDLHKVNVSRRCYLVGYEFNDIWRKPDLYRSVNADGILETAQDEFSEACLFDSVEKAEEVREYLQENFNDYCWYIMLSNGG